MSAQTTSALPHNTPGVSAPPVAEDLPKKMDINSLMSPPDHVIDSFNKDVRRTSGSISSSLHGDISTATRANKHPLPMSPPVSPYSKSIANPSESPATPPAQTVSDPVLYPVEDGQTPSPPQAPLFAPHELEDHQRLVDFHLRNRSSGAFELPTREQYHLVLTFKSQVMKHYKANPKSWLRKERALLEADRRAGAHRYHAIVPAKPKPFIAAKPSRTQRADRVTKPHAVTSGSVAPRPIRSGGPGAGANTSANPGKRSFSRTSATPEPSRRATAPNREDKDFDSIVDYCPPVSSLPDRPNSLKVEWKGQPIDLSSDPHAKMLHPDEVLLAGNLRLDCATYLTSKRRIFERRLQCLRVGKEFRKTDAQQACKIDVNKASKLWTAFDRVGWLDARWVRRFL